MMATIHHTWHTVRQQGLLALCNAHVDFANYLVVFGFPDTIRGRINSHRMVEAIRSVFGPDGAHIISEVTTGDTTRYVVIWPEDVVCAQASLLLATLRDNGWLEEQDFTTEMLPLIEEYWRELSLEQRLEMVDLNDLRPDAVLFATCPLELHMEIQEAADP